MKTTARLPLPVLLSLASLAFFFSSCHTARSEKAFIPVIPKTWDDPIMADLELPLAHAPASPKHLSADYYYSIPVRPIYKSYPVYQPEKEPPGYLDELRRQEPEVLWDDKGTRPKLETEADWIKAGELVFESPMGINFGRLAPTLATKLFVREADWYRSTGAPVTRQGVLPFYRYIIRKNAKIELGILSCAMCHTRILPDGTVIKGAQGNFPFDRAFARDMRDPGAMRAATRGLERLLYGAPWLTPDPQAGLSEMSLDEMATFHEVVPPGVLSRHRSSPRSPVQVPDLIGVQHRRYLDRTGLQRHRGIADLMRYAALNQGGDDLSSFSGFIPAGIDFQRLPKPDSHAFGRYTDEQLYALALYLYSLKPPINPNLPKTAGQKALVKRGTAIFKEEGCAKCHDPKQGYTNNKLIAAPGYEPPGDHPAKDDIMRNASGAPRRISSDPTLTLTTRRGTGFYKVPSLLGVWYRGPFEHNGSCATLEDWFNPARTNDTYVPTGWPGPPGTKTRAVKGHEFGLDLSVEDREALIAFLKTL